MQQRTPRRRRPAVRLLAALAAAVVGATALVAGPVAPPAQAASSLDQSSTRFITPGSYIPVTSGPLRQTFTAGRTGAIDRIAIAFDRYNAQPEVRAEIVTLVDGSFAGGRTLGFATFPAAGANSSPDDLRTVTLEQPAPVTAETQYGILLRSDATAWVRLTTGYDRGRLPGYPEDLSLGFQTYVDDALQAPGLIGGDVRFSFNRFGHATYISTGSPRPEVTIDGSPPPGMTSTNGTGYITFEGTPTRVGSYPITLTVSNGVGPAVPRTVTLTVAPVAPSQPPGLRIASLPDGRISASWDPPSSNGGVPISEYRLMIMPGVGCTTAELSCTLDGTRLTRGSSYPASLTASNSAGDSEPRYGNLVYTTAPSIVRDFSAASDSRRVELAWNTPASNGGAAITQYVVERRSGGGPWSRIGEYGATSRQLTVAGLDNGTAYDFRIAARNEPQGLGPWTEASATPAEAPDTPTGVVARSGDARATVSWQTPNDGGSPITEHLIRHRPLDGDDPEGGDWRLTRILSPDLSEFEFSDLTNGITYEFQVSAVNRAGTGPWSRSVFTVPAGAPFAPVLDSAAPDDRSVHLRWTPPRSDNGSETTGYRVEQRTAGGDWLASEAGVGLDGSTAEVTGLDNGTEYEFRVRAVNAIGTGAASNTLNATPRTVPGTPSNLRAAPADGRVSLSWAEPSSTGGSPVTGYEIQERTPSGDWVDRASASASDRAITLTGLTNGQRHLFRIAAVNAAGVGAWSDPVAATPFVFDPRITGPDGGPLDGRTLHRGDRVALRGDHLPAGASVVVEMHSDPVELGRAVVGVDGSVEIPMSIPADAEYGDHELIAALADAGGPLPSVSVPFSVSARPVTPGPEPGPGPGGGDPDPRGPGSDGSDATPAPEETGTTPAPGDAGAQSAPQALPSTGGDAGIGLAAAAALLLLAGAGSWRAARRTSTGGRRRR